MFKISIYPSSVKASNCLVFYCDTLAEANWLAAVKGNFSQVDFLPDLVLMEDEL